MKTIAKIVLLLVMTITPTLSQGETTKNKWIELAESGYITKEQAVTAIEKEELDRWEMQELSAKQGYEVQKREYEMDEQQNYFQFMLIITTIVATSLCIIIVTIIVFRYKRRKNEKENETLNKLIDKGVLSQGNPANIELLMPKKEVVSANKFMTDATIMGIGFAGLVCNNGEFVYLLELISHILLWVGLSRIIVRTAIAIAIKEKNNKRGATTEPVTEEKVVVDEENK